MVQLIGESQSTFGDMVSELGLAAAMGPKTESTLLAPVNAAFTSKLIYAQGHVLVRELTFRKDIKEKSYFVFHG